MGAVGMMALSHSTWLPFISRSPWHELTGFVLQTSSAGVLGVVPGAIPNAQIKLSMLSPL